MSEYIVVLITASSLEEAKNIGTTLVEERLAACANLIPHVQSIFHWQNKLSQEEEVLILLKTQRSLFERIKQRVQELHSYQVPEIIALPVQHGSESYLNWILTETTL
ncbi:MAG TPA: divalent-cation tolerance protein CutA [Candidatus Limnocylindrales bacterium]|nr:divalent-cation tolerance protein CutA [Candidatus Limnocylindrales bacterium]